MSRSIRDKKKPSPDPSGTAVKAASGRWKLPIYWETVTMFLVSASLVFVVFLLAAILSSGSKDQKVALSRLSIKFEPQKLGNDTGLRAQISSAVPVCMLAFFIQPDKTTLMIPDPKDLDSQARKEVASIKLSPELLQSSKDGHGKLIVAAWKADSPILTQQDLVISDPNNLPLVADGKKLLGKLQDLQKDGNAICQEVVLPDEKIAFMPPPPPPPPPPKPVPVVPKPRSTSASTAAKGGSPRHPSTRNTVTQLQRTNSDQDDYVPGQAGGNQPMQGQRMQGQRIQGQRMR
jgi:hypothetical protein